MARKSSISRLKPDIRSHIERRLREDRLTLDELIADLQQTFPQDDKPSRSALGRYSQHFDKLAETMRRQDDMARLLVSELGENPDDKAGALLVQTLTALTSNATLAMLADDEPADPGDIWNLARSTKAALESKKLSREERAQVTREAREKLLAEQEARLEEQRGADGMSEQLEAKIRGILMGKS